MAAPVGIDYAWAIETGGVLSSAQKRALFAPLFRTVMRYPGLRARLILGRRGQGGFDVEDLQLPDSRLARDAQETAREAIPTFLLNHSYRVYLFATALARLDGVTVDEEAMFVASMLHDLHLGDPAPHGHCFAVAGGQRAETFALEHSVTPERAARIGAEVSGHVTAGGYEDLAGVPDGRAAWLARYAMMLTLVRIAPLP